MGRFYIKFVSCFTKKTRVSLEPKKFFKIVVVKVLKNHSNRGRVVCRLGHLSVNLDNSQQELFLNFRLFAKYLTKGARISPTVSKYLLF